MTDATVVGWVAYNPMQRLFHYVMNLRYPHNRMRWK